MRLGYNTNGLICHDWETGLRLIADLGYQSVALTLDYHCLNPYADDLPVQIARMQKLLAELKLTNVIETGARFLLDPRRKHEPTLLTSDPAARARRVDFLCRAIDLARELESQAVSFWAGTCHDDTPADQLWPRLQDGLSQVVDYATRRNIRLAFEPEPGMLVERCDQCQPLIDALQSPLFGLTIDIGHLHCVEDEPIPALLRKWSPLLFNVHIEDMCRGVHEHLRFGAGEIDFRPVLQTLTEVGYAGGLHVELSRHSHMAPEVAAESYRFLTEILAELSPRGSGSAGCES